MSEAEKAAEKMNPVDFHKALEGEFRHLDFHAAKTSTPAVLRTALFRHNIGNFPEMQTPVMSTPDGVSRIYDGIPKLQLQYDSMVEGASIDSAYGSMQQPSFCSTPQTMQSSSMPLEPWESQVQTPMLFGQQVGTPANVDHSSLLSKVDCNFSSGYFSDCPSGGYSPAVGKLVSDAMLTSTPLYVPAPLTLPGSFSPALNIASVSQARESDGDSLSVMDTSPPPILSFKADTSAVENAASSLSTCEPLCTPIEGESPNCGPMDLSECHNPSPVEMFATQDNCPQFTIGISVAQTSSVSNPCKAQHSDTAQDKCSSYLPAGAEYSEESKVPRCSTESPQCSSYLQVVFPQCSIMQCSSTSEATPQCSSGIKTHSVASRISVPRACNKTTPSQEVLANFLAPFTPSVPDRLIGRRMGAGRLDIIGELHDLSLPQVVGSILSLLDAETLRRMCLVSKSWGSFVRSIKCDYLRKCQHVKELRMYNAIQKENLDLKSPEKTIRVLTESAVPLRAVQPVVMKDPKPAPKPATNHQRFWKAASELQNDQSLRKCPLCCYPAKHDRAMERAVCSNSRCGFDFCSRCRHPWHAARACGSPTKRGRPAVAVGSRKSKRNLKRLL